MSYNEVLNIPCDVFLLMRKKAYIISLQRTKEGCEYLEQCERCKITEPEMDKLRMKMRGGLTDGEL